MGQLYSFPLNEAPIAFLPSCYFTCIGTRRKDDYASDTTVFHKLQEDYWEDLLLERKKEYEAKSKFKEEDIGILNSYLERFPAFSLENISDMKLQFQIFDLNGDGLIDFNEMIQFLDGLGDKSSTESRAAYFEEIDEDGSGAIDFEEFMALVNDLQHKPNVAPSKMGLLYRVGQDNQNTLRQLSLNEKLLNCLF